MEAEKGTVTGEREEKRRKLVNFFLSKLSEIIRILCQVQIVMFLVLRKPFSPPIWWLQQMKKRNKEGLGEGSKKKEEKEREEEEEYDDNDKRKQRYLLFIGNLPYSVTSDDIINHFMKRGVSIHQVRLLTVKDTNQSRGCGFLEFNSLKHQQNALKFHRTKLSGRAINLEVTCGGGGNGENRKTKIKKRNEKLTRNRQSTSLKTNKTKH